MTFKTNSNNSSECIEIFPAGDEDCLLVSFICEEVNLDQAISIYTGRSWMASPVNLVRNNSFPKGEQN